MKATPLNSTAFKVAAWLKKLPNILFAFPVVVSQTGKRKGIWAGALYFARYTTPKDSGAPAAGKQHVDAVIYLVGVPPHHRPGKSFEGKSYAATRNTAYRLAGEVKRLGGWASRDWYMSGYLSPAGAAALERGQNVFHPFGANFMLRPWRVPGNSPIDQYERKPYARETLELHVLDAASMAVRSNPRRRIRAKVRRNPAKQPADNAAARELVLYTTNDADLYRQQVQPIIKNLARKMQKGVYNAELAVKLWRYLADNGAKKYAKEFATPGEQGLIFTPATRDIAARDLRDYYDEHVRDAAGVKGNPRRTRSSKKPQLWIVCYRSKPGARYTYFAGLRGRHVKLTAKRSSAFKQNEHASRVFATWLGKHYRGGKFTAEKA